MGGGLMQLVAYGAQDVYLTGNPQITYFKVVYRRHTNFSMETVEHTLNGNPDFGRGSNVTILRNGDLATRIYLKIRLSGVRMDLSADANSSTERLSVAWVRRLGHCLLKHVDVEIGGSRIDRQFGTWLDIWYELTHDFNQERGYRAMIGDVPELTKLQSVPKTATGQDIIPEYTLYIPMQFWFNRNTGLALPLIALQYHEVRLLFEFEDVNKLIVYSGDAAFDQRKFNMKDASVLVDYIYLDSEERRRFAQVGHEYLIEQVQFTGEETLNDGSRGSKINNKFKLGFNHPTKELIWALKNGAYNGENARNFDKKSRFLTYTNNDFEWETCALDYAAENLARGMISCDKPTNSEVQYVEVTIPSGRDVYTFTYKQNGFDLHITFHLPVPLESSTLVLYIVLNPLIDANDTSSDPYNLGKFIHRFDVALFCDVDVTELVGYDIDVTRHSLKLNDVSIPLEDWIDFRTTTYNGVNKYDVTVVQCGNYGVRLDGKGNPVNEANIQLNGLDRFDMMHGNYFNYVQPYQHHTRTPADGINVYSFALHPEQHQPSGTANLSRIDNTQLNVKFSDPFRMGKNVPQLNLARDSKFYVYAFSYNVLRIMSGMGGLAYSN